jgi:hypothetical protein
MDKVYAAAGEETIKDQGAPRALELSQNRALASTAPSRVLLAHPLTETQAITAACVASLSDVIAQRLLGTRYSPARTIKMAVRTHARRNFT